MRRASGVQAFRRSGVQESLSRTPERLNTRTPEHLNRLAPSVAQVLIAVAWTWCAAVCLHAPLRTATTAMAAAYGLLFLLLLPVSRWSCFLVLVGACASEDVLRTWSPMRYNSLHYATLLLLPVTYALVRPRMHLPKPLIFWLVLGGWFALSVFWSQKPDHSLVWVTEYFGLAGLALLTRQLATSPSRRQELGTVFVLTALASIVALVIVSGVGSGARLGKVDTMNADGFGRLAAMGMLMLAISAADGRGDRSAIRGQGGGAQRGAGPRDPLHPPSGGYPVRGEGAPGAGSPKLTPWQRGWWPISGTRRTAPSLPYRRVLWRARGKCHCSLA
jgi:hypothetical protein